MTLSRRIALVAGLALLPGAALAQGTGPAPGDDALRLAAVRSLSERAGEVHDTVANGFRLAGLMRDAGRAGVDAGQARSHLASRGIRGERAEAAVRRLMRADGDGDGRVTQAEFEADQGARMGAVADAVRGMLAIGR